MLSTNGVYYIHYPPVYTCDSRFITLERWRNVFVVSTRKQHLTSYSYLYREKRYSMPNIKNSFPPLFRLNGRCSVQNQTSYLWLKPQGSLIGIWFYLSLTRSLLKFCLHNNILNWVSKRKPCFEKLHQIFAFISPTKTLKKGLCWIDLVKLSSRSRTYGEFAAGTYSTVLDLIHYVFMKILLPSL